MSGRFACVLLLLAVAAAAMAPPTATRENSPHPRMLRFKGSDKHQPPFHPHGMDGKLQVISCPGGTADNDPHEALLCQGATVVMDVRHDDLDRTVVTCTAFGGGQKRIECHGAPQSLACSPGSSDAPCEFYDSSGKRHLLDVHGNYHSGSTKVSFSVLGLLLAFVAALY